MLLSGAWTISTSRLNIDWVFCFHSGMGSRFQIHVQFLQTMGSYRFSIWIFGCPGLVHPLKLFYSYYIFSLEFALPGCLLSIIYCSLPSWLSTFYIYLLEVYLPNSAIYLFLSSELVGAGAAVIGVVFVVQSLSFLLTWDVFLGVCDTSFMTL